MSDNNRTAMLPGSFDPPTNGHIDIIERSATLFEKLYVVVADNVQKMPLFTPVERMEMLRTILSDHKNIEVVSYRGLVVDFARAHGVGVMIRGVRALVDFGYEFELAMTNKQLNPDLEVLFMPTSPQYFQLRSSAIKEMAAYGADISPMVPPLVVEMMRKRIKLLTL
ncbi:MAG TPA: pantetheine-phosphate adenylyltransferase [Sphaerochaeta sp.]|jgi:pantetheine-phosphate adenylyltransferase|nr:pantetheine-phosphate adenylyltransferase [Spirochaetota bacterium]NLV61578.1 pantetheine-phosphate adenylyltransferase [Spirochaetales bacterium]HOE83632.1 pantetheine-phosphate adenylyltransferase [Sphaerochaeta sp.]HOQ93760.1 pantetheine-phosphate adenylyltransferase [Sphaerochaeta sp.]HPK46537.1 pantetheine-phosphate adenylyltransferase [Sphaerochaeta sp.]